MRSARSLLIRDLCTSWATAGLLLKAAARTCCVCGCRRQVLEVCIIVVAMVAE